MTTLIYIIIFTTLGSLLALLGGVILLTRKKLSHTITHGLSAFAAGALLGAAFLDLLPETFHHFEEMGMEEVEGQVLLYTLIGILLFFLLERSIHWFHHHHHQHNEDEPTSAVVPLVIFGDGVHNFIDGILIAATFMVDIQLGMITTVAIAAHELPQEIGDFGILLHAGLSKKKALVYNLLSQLTAVIGGVATYFIGNSIEGVIPDIIAVTSGFFIYIALTDLIPDIHNENRKGFALIESALLFVGIFVIWASINFLPHGH
jgi:zinc and cadmium transporter